MCACHVGTRVLEVETKTTFVSRGCARRTNSLAWSKRINLIAFASASDICLASAKAGNVEAQIYESSGSHHAPVTCVKFFSWHNSDDQSHHNSLLPSSSSRSTYLDDLLISGASNSELFIWKVLRDDDKEEKESGDEIINRVRTSHNRQWSIRLLRKCRVSTKSSLNQPITYCAGAVIINNSFITLLVASSVPDGSLCIQWHRSSTSDSFLSNLGNEKNAWFTSTTMFQPAYVCSIALGSLSNDFILLIVGKTDTEADVLKARINDDVLALSEMAVLQGHEDWISALDLKAADNNLGERVYYVATGSPDCVIRLWHLTFLNENHENQFEQLNNCSSVIAAGDSQNSVNLNISLQAVLTGHSDWVCSLEWHPCEDKLLSASNDRTVIEWEPSEEAQGLWMDKLRLGDMGAQAVGFFGACYSSSGSTIMAHNYFGAFFAWSEIKTDQSNVRKFWEADAVFSGHSAAVKDIAWSPCGSYLLSCSFDQTTRCFAPCPEKNVVFEIARPQVHGYDLNCVTSLNSHLFVSGADEKILRAFNATKHFVSCLKTLSRFDTEKLFPDLKLLIDRVVTLPALGLSNKADDENRTKTIAARSADVLPKGYPEQFNDYHDLLTEEHRMHSTLWPEVQKLYGHGFEVYAVASNHAGSILASSCKASQSSSATIMIWDTDKWKRHCELHSHKLTVVQLAFSFSDHFLLSVSRDRTFSIFTHSSTSQFEWQLLMSSTEIGIVHSRIIWGCAWSPNDSYFATGARDKKLCIWRFCGDKNVTLAAETNLGIAVTAVDFLPVEHNSSNIVAYGLENGEIGLLQFSDVNNIYTVSWRKIITRRFCDTLNDKKQLPLHLSTTNRLKFRPPNGHWLKESSEESSFDLAAASDDNAVRIFQVKLCYRSVR